MVNAQPSIKSGIRSNMEEDYDLSFMQLDISIGFLRATLPSGYVFLGCGALRRVD